MSNDVYSKLQHLADAVFFHHDPRSRYFVMITSYTGYFDTAGSRSDGEILVSGGLVTSVEQWKDFDEHWKSILDKAGIQEFHMTDFVTGQGQFTDPKWKKNNGYAENFLKKLVNAICKQHKRSSPIYAPTFRINLDEWKELNKEYLLLESNFTPLSLAAGSCIGAAYKWCLDRGISPNHLECFHEDGDLDKGTLRNLMKKCLGIELQFKSKKLSPLQACDLLAWEAANPAKQKSKNPNLSIRIRPSMRELLSRIQCYPNKFTIEGWRNVCDEYDIPKRNTSVSLSHASDNRPVSQA